MDRTTHTRLERIFEHPLTIALAGAMSLYMLAHASGALGDELRLTVGATRTTVDGAVTSLVPRDGQPPMLQFAASSVRTQSLPPTAVYQPNPYGSLSWTLTLQNDNGYVVVDCAGPVPAFLGDQFTVDWTCKPFAMP